MAALIPHASDPGGDGSGDGEDPQARKRRPRELTQTSFEKLLERLHPDRDKAAERYEMLRQKVMFYLRHHGDSQSLADDVFDIVGSKLAEGLQIEKLDKLRSCGRTPPLERRPKERRPKRAVE